MICDLGGIPTIIATHNSPKLFIPKLNSPATEYDQTISPISGSPKPSTPSGPNPIHIQILKSADIVFGNAEQNNQPRQIIVKHEALQNDTLGNSGNNSEKATFKTSVSTPPSAGTFTDSLLKNYINTSPTMDSLDSSAPPTLNQSVDNLGTSGSEAKPKRPSVSLHDGSLQRASTPLSSKSNTEAAESQVHPAVVISSKLQYDGLRASSVSPTPSLGYNDEGSKIPEFLAPIIEPIQVQNDTPHGSMPGNVALGQKSLYEFAMEPCQPGKKYQCYILRSKDTVEKHMFPVYEFYLENTEGGLDVFLMAARKRKKSKSSNYLIATAQGKDIINPREEILGKLRSNFLGTSFAIFDNGYNPMKNKIKSSNQEHARKQYGSVAYETNILGFKGPRKMTVLLPKTLKTGKPITIQPKSEDETLAERFRKGELDDMLILKNKQPQWNDESQSYVLNFNGRVTAASVKNFQIIHESDPTYIILQFGRVSDGKFTIDIQYPITPFQAFTVALSSFDAKIACE